MALVVKDRVKVRSTTTGTGTLTLGTAFAGFQTFNNALGDGDTTYYGIFESSTGEFEVGIGTFTSSGNTLSRDTVLESSNTGAKVDLTADTEVFITYPAEKSVYFDANGDVNLTRDPQSALQAATKQYVDTIAAAGLHYHPPVRVQTTANLTATYNNGSSGVGATLTNSGTQAAISIDNVTLSSADRVLVSEQTNAAHNGVYTVTDVGSASTNWVLTRATDADSYGPSDPDALGEGDAFFIKEGDTNAGHLDVMTTSGEIVFGTTDIVFSEVAETTVYSAGNGLSLSGTEFNVGAGTGITVDATTVSTAQDIATSATPTFAGLTVDTDTLYVDATNNRVGVGTTTPSQKVEISDTSTADVALRMTNNDGNLEIQKYQDDLAIKLNDTGDIIIRSGSPSLLQHMRIASNGDISFYENTGTNVNFFWDASTMALGIGTGTTTPTNPLTIQQTSVHWPYIALTNSSGVTKSQFGYQVGDDLLDIAANSGGIKFRTNNTETMRLTSAGRLGIGEQSPDSALHITGTADSSSQIKLERTSVGTTVLGYQYVGTFSNNPFLIYTNSSEQLRIHTSGRISVNTTTDNGAMIEVVQDTDGYSRGFRASSQASPTTYAALAMVNGTDAALTAGYSSSVNTNLTFYTASSGTETEAMRISSGGVLSVGNSSPKSWQSNTTGVIQFGGVGSLENYNATDDVVILSANVYRAASDGNFKYIETNESSRVTLYQGDVKVQTAPSGTADTNATFTERLTIKNTGNVGIGATSPSTNLHVKSSGFGDLYQLMLDDGSDNAGLEIGTYGSVGQISGSTGLDFELNKSLAMRITTDGEVAINKTTVPNDSGNNYKTLLVSNEATSKSSRFLAMGAASAYTSYSALTSGTHNGTTFYSPALIYTSSLRFFSAPLNNEPDDTNLTERMRIDSSGRLLVGKTSADNTTAGHRFDPSGFMSHVRDDATIAVYNRLTSDGDIIDFRKDGTTVGSIGSFASGARLYFAGGSSALTVLTNEVYPASNTGAAADGTMNMGSSGARFKDLYLSGNLSDGTTSRTVADIVGLTSSQFLRSDAVDSASDVITFEDGLKVGTGSGVGTSGRATISFGEGSPPSDTFLIEYDGDNLAGDQNALIFRNNNVGEAMRMELGGAIKLNQIMSTTSGSSGGIRVGANSSGYPNITTVNGVELVFRDTDQIRFSDSTSWDYSAWAGIRYESGSNLMTIGGPSSSKFTSNAGPSDITINFDGLSGVDGLTYEGNPIWHDGNTWSVIDYVGDITTQNWNDYIDGSEASWARVLNMSGSNRPPNYTYGTVLNISYSTANKFQLYASHTGSSGNGLYFRTGWNTDYKGWAKIYDSVAHPALSYVDVATGNYGTIKVDDDRGVTWAGYAIRDDWVFMSSGDGAAGIYNDTDNEWAIYCVRNAATALYYNGTATFATTSGGAAVTGALTATGDITAYYSDERLKNFEGKIDGALDKVSQLNGYYFRENDKAKELGYDNDDRQVGVSAQEVEAVLPEIIKPAPVDPEYKTVQYEKLVPLLIEAIKELKEEVRQLKGDKA